MTASVVSQGMDGVLLLKVLCGCVTGQKSTRVLRTNLLGNNLGQVRTPLKKIFLIVLNIHNKKFTLLGIFFFSSEARALFFFIFGHKAYGILVP